MYTIVEKSQVVFRHEPWRKVKDFVSRSGAKGGINFGFFQRSYTHPTGSTPLGMVIEDGQVTTWWDPSVFWVGVIGYKNGDVKIEFSPESWAGHVAKLASIDWAISGGPVILYDGMPTIFQANKFPGVNVSSRVQRVALGITSEQRVVFAYLPSATALEMANHLKEAGAVQGILGDGGSSASYVDGNTSYGSQLVPNFIGWKEESIVKPCEPCGCILGLDEVISQAEALLSSLVDVRASNTCSAPFEVTKPPMIRPNYEANGGFLVTAANHYMNPDKVKYLVLHHDGGVTHDDKSALEINQYHRRKGWAGIGYHAWVRRDGTIEEGRPLNRRGAHVGTIYNPISWGVAMSGNYSIANSVPTPTWRSTVHLFAYLKTLAPDAEIVGDGELTRSTECPGINVNMDQFRADVEKYLRGEV